MKKIITEIGVNKFVKRQIKNSGKTYSETLSFDEIANLGKIHLSQGCYKKGYRNGVIIIKINKEYTHHFTCPFVKINEKTQLKAKLVSRRAEEAPYIQIRALNGTPLSTGSVELILYSNKVLKETKEQSTQSSWELISFHAIPKGIINMPMGPITMMRNQLQLKGGTKGDYSSHEWAESIKFWQNFAILDPKINN